MNHVILVTLVALQTWVGDDNWYSTSLSAIAQLLTWGDYVIGFDLFFHMYANEPYLTQHVSSVVVSLVLYKQL